MTTEITKHEGKKYLRTVYPAFPVDVGVAAVPSILIDVYCVLEAFQVICPATAHAVKKLLCAGERSKGSRLQDLEGARAAINRAIELEKQR